MPSLRARLGALALGLAAAGLMAEIVTRVLDLAPTTVVVIADADAYARVPGVYLPSKQWTGAGRALRFDVQINSLGYRGAEPPARATDALRIVFVGDSLVFGDFVADDETWPVQLQALLTCRRPVIVYNAGIAGSTLTESIPMAERAGVLRPDLIVAEFTAENDIDDLAGPSLWSRMEARRQVGPVLETAYRTLYRSALWNALRQARTAASSRARRANLHANPDNFDQAQRRYEQLLGSWVAQLRDRNMPLVFAVFPGYPMLARGDRRLHNWAIGVARRAGLQPVDLWPAFFRDGRSPDELFLVPEDRHPSAKGYAAAARPLAEALVEQVAAFKDCRTSFHSATTERRPAVRHFQ
jgi:lysophospholipase L1-like esterase